MFRGLLGETRNVMNTEISGLQAEEELNAFANLIYRYDAQDHKGYIQHHNSPDTYLVLEFIEPPKFLKPSKAEWQSHQRNKHYRKYNHYPKTQANGPHVRTFWNMLHQRQGNTYPNKTQQTGESIDYVVSTFECVEAGLPS